MMEPLRGLYLGSVNLIPAWNKSWGCWEQDTDNEAIKKGF